MKKGRGDAAHSKARMNIWILEIGELLPLNPDVRRMRVGLLAQKLVERGHRVRWWASAFEHQRKIMLFEKDTIVQVSPGITLQILRGWGYRRNISLARYIDHRIIARKFRLLCRKMPLPDAVIALLPCHRLAYEAVTFCKENNIPIIVDIEDKWPSIFVDRLSNTPLYQIGRFALSGEMRCARTALRRADALCAVSSSYMDWALENAGRPRTAWDRVFYLGYERMPSSSGYAYESGEEPSWLSEMEGQTIFAFIGTFGMTYDLRLVVQVARRMWNNGRRNASFILAGAGERLPAIKKYAEDLPNVSFPGWINAKDIQSLLRRASIGLLPYAVNAPQSLSYKPFEYLSAGLPLVSSLSGEMAEMIKSFGLGQNYHAGDPEKLQQCIETFLDDEALREEMSHNASIFYSKHGDADKIYSDYSEHIERFVEAQHR
ncbi:MAG: glycosyltransferase [Desulfobaccales bacterium]